MAAAKMSLPQAAYPGLVLGLAADATSGPGTQIHDGKVVATLSGQSSTLNTGIQQSQKKSKIVKSNFTLCVHPAEFPTNPEPHSGGIRRRNALPCVGSVVLAKVVRVRLRQVDVVIQCIGDILPVDGVVTSTKDQNASVMYGGDLQPCLDMWPAVIRREDIRATEKDKVVCADGFKVGDTVRGQVISLGDQANYYLTTAKNELGVLLAKSEVSGSLMQPFSWKEFRDPISGMTEARKVAKPY